MNTDILTGLIRPYLPTIQKNFLPKVDDMLAQNLQEAQANSHSTEAVYMISVTDGKPFLRTVQLDEHATVVQASEPIQVSQYLAELINQALK